MRPSGGYLGVARGRTPHEVGTGRIYQVQGRLHRRGVCTGWTRRPVGSFVSRVQRAVLSWRAQAHIGDRAGDRQDTAILERDKSDIRMAS